jgi:hypothetical protein
MKHKIISTENYLLIVDDSQITEGDWHIKINKNKVGNYPLDSVNPNKGRYKKIIAHLPLNGASILDGVDLLPPLEDDVELLIPFPSHKLRDGSEIKTWMNGWEEGHKEGYNKAKEQFRYTEEDLRKAIKMARKDFDEEGYLIDRLTEDEIIQSLQPKMPIGFNLEAKDTHIQNGVLVKSQWVGEYIFE